ncbi:sensor histidine kinase [Gracilibacillus oryzae]|nr:histidine kinase [Gracilibacillus oryzae]
MRESLESSTRKQLDYSVEQLEKDLHQLEIMSILLINDRSITSYNSSFDFSSNIDHLLKRKYVEEKLKIQQNIIRSFNEFTVYWPQTEEIISTHSETEYNENYLVEAPKNKWFPTLSADGNFTFSFMVTSPLVVEHNIENVITVVETSFTSDFLDNVLSLINASGNANSFFYFSNNNSYSSNGIEESIIAEIAADPSFNKESGSLIAESDKVKYAVHYRYISSLDAKIVSYTELDRFLAPLNDIKYLIYLCLFTLFMTGILMAYLLHRHLRYNMKHLVNKIDQLGRGQYESRVTIKANNEFDYLFSRFNRMAQKIQALIEDVYEAKLRTREAQYKHLQSQINPHFLYNCLFYIVSMAKRSPEAVIRMADNLAKYYRYITRKNADLTELCDEISFLKNYLEVQSLRNNQLIYRIDIDEEMNSVMIPPLTIQPIIENAIIHGIDKRKGAGEIKVTGEASAEFCRIIIEDDGKGLHPAELNTLLSTINQNNASEKDSYGLWNINQRLRHYYGSKANVLIQQRSPSGLRVTITFPKIPKTHSLRKER